MTTTFGTTAAGLPLPLPVCLRLRHSQRRRAPHPLRRHAYHLSAVPSLLRCPRLAHPCHRHRRRQSHATRRLTSWRG